MEITSFNYYVLQAAEMPYYFLDGNYLFGCIARGVVKGDSYIDGKNIVAGDVLIGLPSGGVHSNGFYLINRSFFTLIF